MHTITIYFIISLINKTCLVRYLLHRINYHSPAETSKTTFSSWCIDNLIFLKKSRLEISQKKKENFDLLKEYLIRSSDKTDYTWINKTNQVHIYILLSINIYIHTRTCTRMLSVKYKNTHSIRLIITWL